MNDISLPFHGKARIWSAAPPELCGAGSGTISQEFEACGAMQFATVYAAVELFLPRGPFAHYGLLGAEFIPAHTHRLVARVTFLENLGPKVPWALAARVDDVREGLPIEFAEAVLRGTEVADGRKCMSSGTLFFNRSACGAVGSAPIVFERLASALVAIIASNGGPLPEKELREILCF